MMKMNLVVFVLIEIAVKLIVQGDLKTFLVATSLHKSRPRMLDIETIK